MSSGCVVWRARIVAGAMMMLVSAGAWAQGTPAGGAPGGAPSGAVATPPPAAGKTVLDYIRDGGSIGFIIIMLSLVAVGLIVAGVVRIRPKRLAPPEVVARMEFLLRDRRTDEALAFCEKEENDCFLTRVVGSALRRCMRSPFGFLELRSALEESGQNEVSRLYRSTDWIGVIAGVAPMLGLLGTVVGMVGAFDTLSQAEGVARPDQLAGNISLALITTVLGLIVAIPTTAALVYLRNRIDHFAGEVAQQIEDLAGHLETASAGGAKAPGAPQAPRVPPAVPLATGPAGVPGGVSGAVPGVRPA
jgi:biopolymer transport protein ExbB